MKQANVRVVVSGSAWMGSGLGSIGSALYRLFEQANDEVTIVAFAISSAATMLFQQLTALLQRGIRVRLLVNRFTHQPSGVQKQCHDLQRRFPNLVQVLSFTPQSSWTITNWVWSSRGQERLTSRERLISYLLRPMYPLFICNRWKTDECW